MIRASAFLVALVALTACADPVHDAAVEALGPEAPDVPEGPLHRPGQPCLTCHGGEGPAKRVLSLAGTVYETPAGGAAVAGARVRVVDQAQASIDLESNCAGNFFIDAAAFSPTFPAVAAVTTSTTIVMRTVMHRSGSCNDCHTGTPGSSSPGFVWATLAALPKECRPASP